MHSLTIKFEPCMIFFTPDIDSNWDNTEVLSQSYTMSNLSGAFIRGVYSALYNINNDCIESTLIDLESDIKFEYPFDSILAHLNNRLANNLCPAYDDSKKIVDFKSMSVVNYYNKYWKQYILNGVKYDYIKTPTKRYVIEMHTGCRTYILQFDSLDYLAGILSGISWISGVRGNEYKNFKLGHIHDNGKLAQVRVRYMIDTTDIRKTYETLFDHVRKSLNLVLINDIIDIINSYLPSICSSNESYRGNIIMSRDRMKLLNSERFIICVTECEYNSSMCSVCMKSLSVTEFYSANVELEVVEC